MKAKPKTFTFPQTITLMGVVCGQSRCGTAACIGGWASIFLLGFEGSIDKDVKRAASRIAR